MYSPERLVINLTKKASEAMQDIAEANDFKTKTEIVVWALKYANEVRKLVGEDGVLVIEKDGFTHRIRIM